MRMPGRLNQTNEQQRLDNYAAFFLELFNRGLSPQLSLRRVMAKSLLAECNQVTELQAANELATRR
jgi:hypothetical protein